MNRIRACLLGGISIGLLLLVFWHDADKRNLNPSYEVNGKPIEYVDSVLGIAIVEDVSFLQNIDRFEMTDNTQIFFENTLVPYDQKEKRLYVSQNPEVIEWEGFFTTENDTFLCTTGDAYWEKKADAIRDNYEFPVWFLTEDGYCRMTLVASGLPIISIDTERYEEAEEIPYEVDPDKKFYGSETQYYGQIRVFDPGRGDANYEILESKVCYHAKGISSSVYPKKGYSLSLLDENEENLEMPLLGMRADNSWKLNALMSDSTKIREKSAAQIWEQMDLMDGTVDEPGPRMEYTEVILDGEYLGLYCLVEPVDEKKLNLDANDVLYKIIDWDEPSDEEIQVSVQNKWRISLPIRIRYPKVITDYDAAWYPIRDYLNIFYRDYWQYGGADNKIDLENACDMVLFMMTCSASDNTFKNLYLAADVSAPGEYVMRHIPWDLDLTFGNVHDPNAENGVRFNEDVEVTYWDAPVSTMIYYEIDGVYDTFISRWQKYRKEVLANDNIIAILEQNREYLLHSGVYSREAERWSEYEIDDDITELVNYQNQRMEWLDEYFYELK
ncbi:MAG: hypothetical protein E7299_00480 [Lachnospiraceae bacterium]|nr:hypothetical protein [Lachnospiraceae bacterium]